MSKDNIPDTVDTDGTETKKTPMIIPLIIGGAVIVILVISAILAFACAPSSVSAPIGIEGFVNQADKVITEAAAKEVAAVDEDEPSVEEENGGGAVDGQLDSDERQASDEPGADGPANASPTSDQNPNSNNTAPTAQPTSSNSASQTPSSGSSNSNNSNNTPPSTKQKVWVVDKAAYDERVVDKPAWDENVLVSAAYDEQVITGYVAKCNQCGYVLKDQADWRAHVEKTGHWSYSTGVPNYKTVHHDAVYKTVHHEATYKTVHHPEEGHWEYR